MAEDRDFTNRPGFDELNVDEDQLVEAMGAALDRFSEFDLGVDVIAIELAPIGPAGILAERTTRRGGCPPGYIMINGRCVRRP